MFQILTTNICEKNGNVPNLTKGGGGGGNPPLGKKLNDFCFFHLKASLNDFCHINWWVGGNVFKKETTNYDFKKGYLCYQINILKTLLSVSFHVGWKTFI